MRVQLSLLCAASVAVGLAGCSQTTGVTPAATATTATTADTASDPAPPPRVIVKGMEGDEIVRRIGRPSEIRPLETSAGQAEVWVYRRNAGNDNTLTATRVVQTPVVNPLTGVRFTVPEPSYSVEHRDLVEITNLLMFEGKLTEWTRSVEVKRAFD